VGKMQRLVFARGVLRLVAVVGVRLCEGGYERLLVMTTGFFL
jgi:hypothetical protein